MAAGRLLRNVRKVAFIAVVQPAAEWSRLINRAKPRLLIEEHAKTTFSVQEPADLHSNAVMSS